MMGSELQLSAELAQEWWCDHSPDGVVRASGGFSQSQWDRAQAVSDYLDDCAAASPESLKQVLELLAGTAATSDDLSYIGTWFLENAYASLGESVLIVLQASDLSDEKKALIRSGFQR